MSLSTACLHKRPSLPSHLFCSCRLFPINFGEINARGSSTKQSKCPSPLLFARDPLVCLFSLSSKQASRLQSIIGECNEMVMLVRTIPRPAPAFRPPALNGDNNFSSRRGGGAYWPYMQSATCQNRNIRSAHTSSASHWSSWNG